MSAKKYRRERIPRLSIYKSSIRQDIRRNGHKNNVQNRR